MRIAVFVFVLAGAYIVLPTGDDLAARLTQAAFVIGLGAIIVVFPRAWLIGAVPLVLAYTGATFGTTSAVTATLLLVLGPPLLRRFESGVRSRLHRRRSAESDGAPPPVEYPLADAVSKALRAAVPLDARPVSTGALLEALSKVDRAGDWPHFWLACGYPSLERLRAAADPKSSPAPLLGRSYGVDVTTETGRALQLANALSGEYRLGTIGPGAVALAILADPCCGATQTVQSVCELDARAVRDAVQRDLVGVELEAVEVNLPRLRTTAATARQTTPRRRRGIGPVGVLAAATNRPSAAVVADWLRAEDIAVGAPDGTSIVVVLTSEAAASDSEWKAAVKGLPADTMIVPVRLDQVSADALPSTIRPITRIEWNWERGMDTRLAVLKAVLSDRRHYRMFMVLAAEAEEWERQHRPASLLIRSAKRAAVAGQYLQDAAGDASAAPTPAIEQFIRASMKAAGLEARQTVWRWLYRLTLAGLTVTAVSLVVLVFQTENRLNNTNVFAVGAFTSIDNRPDRIAMLNAAVLLQPGDGDWKTARRSALEKLAEPWAVGLLGQGDYPRQLAAVISADERQSVTLDGAGALTAWDNRSLTPLWRRAVLPDHDQSLRYLDADPQMRTFFLATTTALHVVDASSWHDTVIPMPARPTRIAVALRDRFIAVDAEGLRLVALDGGGIRPSPALGDVLDLRRQTDGSVRALLRHGDRLLVADPATGKEFGSAVRPGHPFEKGALGSDGSVAWTGPDRQIQLARYDLGFEPTGQKVPDVLEVLRPMSDGRVAFGGGQFGVRVYDDRAHAEVGLLCRESAGVEDLALSAGEDMVGCLDSYAVELWRTRELSPLTAPPPDVAGIGRMTRVAANRFDAEGRADGAIVVHVSGAAPIRFDVSDSAFTAAAAGPDWVVAGTAGGEVGQWVVTHDEVVGAGKWTAPTGAPVTAVGADPTHAGQLIVATGDGLWWTLPSCLDCTTEQAVVEHVKQRLWGCYTDNQLELLGTRVREALGVRPCPPPLAATR